MINITNSRNKYSHKPEGKGYNVFFGWCDIPFLTSLPPLSVVGWTLSCLYLLLPKVKVMVNCCQWCPGSKDIIAVRRVYNTGITSIYNTHTHVNTHMSYTHTYVNTHT